MQVNSYIEKVKNIFKETNPNLKVALFKNLLESLNQEERLLTHLLYSVSMNIKIKLPDNLFLGNLNNFTDREIIESLLVLTTLDNHFTEQYFLTLPSSIQQLFKLLLNKKFLRVAPKKELDNLLYLMSLQEIKELIQFYKIDDKIIGIIEKIVSSDFKKVDNNKSLNFPCYFYTLPVQTNINNYKLGGFVKHQGKSKRFDLPFQITKYIKTDNISGLFLYKTLGIDKSKNVFYSVIEIKVVKDIINTSSLNNFISLILKNNKVTNIKLQNSQYIKYLKAVFGVATNLDNLPKQTMLCFDSNSVGMLEYKEQNYITRVLDVDIDSITMLPISILVETPKELKDNKFNPNRIKLPANEFIELFENRKRETILKTAIPLKFRLLGTNIIDIELTDYNKKDIKDYNICGVCGKAITDKTSLCGKCKRYIKELLKFDKEEREQVLIPRLLEYKLKVKSRTYLIPSYSLSGIKTYTIQGPQSPYKSAWDIKGIKSYFDKIRKSL